MRALLTLLAICWIAATPAARAQAPDLTEPAHRMPKVPDETLVPMPKEPEAPRSPRSPTGDQEYIPGLKLQGVVIVKSAAEVSLEAVPVPPAGVEVRGIPLLSGPEFPPLIRKYFGRPITENMIRDMQDDIILYCRAQNRPLIDVILKEQDISNGVIQLWFIEGVIGSIEVSNPGKRWFSDDLIRGQVRLQHGATVNSDSLLRDLEWLNRNPFREVGLVYKAGTNTGLSDIELRVNDRFPFRFYAGYEDTGTTFTGEDRYLAGLNWGHAFGLDHQFNYQYSTDVDFDLLMAHSVSYLAPLPWRHVVSVFGTYVDAKTDFGSVNPLTNVEGTSYQASMRYAVPLPKVLTFQHEASAGLDFKQTDNDLEFGGSSASNTKSEILQFMAGYSLLVPDPYGQTTFSTELFYSPGDLTGRNDDEHFDALRPNSTADYFYARLGGERVTRLPWDFSWVIRGGAQFTSDRLLPSEQYGLGGYRTVRGYDERLLNGDEGWTVSNELRTPGFPLLNLLPGGRNVIQFLAFYDYGDISIVDEEPGEIAEELSAVGAGLRYMVGTHISFRFDYAWQLSNKELSEDINVSDSRAHIGVLVSF